MTASVELAVYSAISLLGLVLLTANSLLRSPKWLDDDLALKSNWKTLTWHSAITGVVFGLAALTVNMLNDWNQQSVVFASLGGYMFYQSIFTDFRLRMVDRWGQRIANLLAFGVGCYVLATYGFEVDWIIYLSFIAATFAIGLLPGVGNSDGRAFMFLVIASYPVGAVAAMQWAALLYLGSIILYYVGMSIWKKEFSLKGLFTKVSFPMVPIILFPVLTVTIFGRALPGF